MAPAYDLKVWRIRIYRILTRDVARTYVEF